MLTDRQYQSAPLAEQHLIDAFCCGVPTLDTWLQTSARHAAAIRTASTHVWTDGRSPRVVAYYSLTNCSIGRADLPPKDARSAPAQVPAVLLGKLALDESLRGKHLGGELLLDALTTAAESAKLSAARYVVLDAINPKVAAFYAHYGFRALDGNPLRLVQKMSSVEKALEGRTGALTQQPMARVLQSRGTARSHQAVGRSRRGAGTGPGRS